MKNIQRIFLIAILLLTSYRTQAQLNSALWVTLGAEMRQGSYSGVNAFYTADRYNMLNRTTFRFEAIEPKTINMSIDATGLITFSKQNFGESDTTFQHVWDRPRFRWCMYKLYGDKQSKTRFGVGGQINWRIFGVGQELGAYKETYGRSDKAGPITAKGRFGIGPNIHLAHQFNKRIYSRLSLYADYEPGMRNNGINIYPEFLVIGRYKAVGLMANIAYRYSYFIGDPNLGPYVSKPKNSASSNTIMYGIGAALNLGKFM